jgi:ABC-type lipoprotein export system ATPase subunit
MLTKLHFRNFKRFEDVAFDLDQLVVLIGPNNSGKTTALQALALWELGMHRWTEKRGSTSRASQRTGVSINRRDLLSIPVSNANLLWRNLRTRLAERDNGRQDTQNIRIDVTVHGVNDGKQWVCGLEFDYANDESLYCRPLRLDNSKQPARMDIPEAARLVRTAFLPPMSGLADREFIKQAGEVGVLIGQGQTAQVLRNLCYRVAWPDGNPSAPPSDAWQAMKAQIERLFGARLHLPEYIAERSEIVMAYEEQGDIRLDLASAGRGLQQTLLMLAHLYSNPRTVLLLDEPDAHLEVLRQRQIYQVITDLAGKLDSQIIAASHSEVVLNEAAERGTVIAFVGRPHRLTDRGAQVVKALTDLGWDQYYQAELTGWVLYVENATDLAILQAFAKKLQHPAAEVLERPFVNYVASNVPQKARDHFYGLQEAKTDLVGIAIFDRLEKPLQKNTPLLELMWQRREIENYFCTETVLMAWAVGDSPNDLFAIAEQERRVAAMRHAIDEVTRLLAIDEKSPWSPEVKATDEVLDRIFRVFFREMNLPVLFRKQSYYELIDHLPIDQFAPEITDKLDALVAVAARALPRKD